MYNRVKRTAEGEKKLGVCVAGCTANGEAAGGKGKKKRLPFCLFYSFSESSSPASE